MEETRGRPDWERAIVASHRALVGEELCPAEDLFDYRGVVLCHDTSSDPLFVYANRTAQRLWRRSWEHFIGMPSRLTAPVQERAQRAAALQRNVVVRGYEGLRVDSGGTLFEIREATVWPVHEDGDVKLPIIGQAATFLQWEFRPEDQLGERDHVV